VGEYSLILVAKDGIVRDCKRMEEIKKKKGYIINYQ
jgi:hypothetical protein